MTGGAVLIFAAAWLALAIICGMLAEYRHKIVAALHFEPIPRDQPTAGYVRRP